MGGEGGKTEGWGEETERGSRCGDGARWDRLALQPEGERHRVHARLQGVLDSHSRLGHSLPAPEQDWAPRTGSPFWRGSQSRVSLNTI